MRRFKYLAYACTGMHEREDVAMRPLYIKWRRGPVQTGWGVELYCIVRSAYYEGMGRRMEANKKRKIVCEGAAGAGAGGIALAVLLVTSLLPSTAWEAEDCPMGECSTR